MPATRPSATHQPRRRPEPRRIRSRPSSAGRWRNILGGERCDPGGHLLRPQQLANTSASVCPKASRVTRRDLEPDDWHVWKTDLACPSEVGRVLTGNSSGARAPGGGGSRSRSSSEFFEYLYHQVLRKEDEWAASSSAKRSAPRGEGRRPPLRPPAGRLPHLYTTPHVMLDDPLTMPINEGDIFQRQHDRPARPDQDPTRPGPLHPQAPRQAPAPTRSTPTGSLEGPGV